MTMPYQSAEGMRVAAQETLEQYLPEVLALYADARPSHIGFDCADENALATMIDFSKNLGEMVEKPKGDKMIVFIKLDQPIIYQDYALPYLELIGPDQDPTQRRNTGIRAFVSTLNDTTLEQDEKIPSGRNPNILLRFHRKSAAELSGLGL